jgi:hypothetical protein
MRFKFHFGLAAIAMTCLAFSAIAQQPGQPGGRGGDRGRGGGPPMFGGGGNFTSRLSLLRIAEVRKELELADEQVAAIEMLDEDLRAKYPIGGRGGPGGPGGPGGGPGGDRRRGGGTNEGASLAVPAQWFFVQQEQQPGQGRGGRGFFPGGGGFTPEQRAEMEKARAERDREANTKLADILLPHQIKRLNEIYVQQAGTAALLDEEVGKQLGITAAQRTEIAKVRDANDEAMRSQGREAFAGLDEEARRAKFIEMRKANDDKVIAVLNADQKRKFEEMKGKAFAMPEFGRGRGGPGGPGGPGGFGGRGPGGGRPGNN